MPGTGLRLLTVGLLATSVAVVAQQAQRPPAPGSASTGSTRPTTPAAAGQPLPAPVPAHGEASPVAAPDPALVQKYCVTCHNARARTGGLSLEGMNPAEVATDGEVWEKVARKIRGGMMPPQGMPRPDEAILESFVTGLETALETQARLRPDPGFKSVHRLNRTEYGNVVRDLLNVDVNVADLLPADDESNGFDNQAGVLRVSPSLLEQYLAAARKISSLAVGTDTDVVRLSFRIPPDDSQEEHVEGLPLGTRGGLVFTHTFPQNGEYDIQVWLARDLSGNVSGLRDPQPHELLLLVDREPVATFTVKKPADGDDTLLDKDLKARITMLAGPHDIGVTFVKEGSSLVETARQPTQAHFNDRRHPRIGPAINQISVTGPYGAKGAENTPSRQRLFVCQPRTGAKGSASTKEEDDI